MNEEIFETLEEEETTTETVTEPEEVTEPEPVVTAAPVTVTVIETTPAMSDYWVDNSENIIHELFSEIGVNLDYVPQTKFEMFSMSLQFVAALWFIWSFTKVLFKFTCSMLRGGI